MNENIAKYRERRSAIQVRRDRPSRSIALDTSLLSKGEAAANLPLALIQRVEAAVKSAMTKIDEYSRNIGMKENITLRRDWTYRTFSSECPRSKGGATNGRTRSIDYDLDFTYGPHCSLRLAKLAESFVECERTDYDEYSRIRDSVLVGSLFNLTIEQKVAVTLAHECAHAIVINSKHRVKDVMCDANDFLETNSDRPNWSSKNCELVNAIARKADEWRSSGNYRLMNGRQHTIWGAHEAAWQSIYADLRKCLGLKNGVEGIQGKSETNRVRENICECCGINFKTKRPAKTCSSKCRVKLGRIRKLV